MLTKILFRFLIVESFDMSTTENDVSDVFVNLLHIMLFCKVVFFYKKKDKLMSFQSFKKQGHFTIFQSPIRA